MTDRLPWMSSWRSRALWLLATATPLRWLPVRNAVSAAAGAAKRARRRRLERRGDVRLSTPAFNGIDVRLAELLGRDGYFVEAGAFDGYTVSNTYYLERFMGWRGTLIEAIPSLAAEARRNRPRATVVQAALVDPARRGSTIEMRYGGSLSFVAGATRSESEDETWVQRNFVGGTAPRVVVDGRTLSDILESLGAPEVTLLSLDVEGFEAPALEGLDLERHAPRWILVEVLEPERREAIESVLGDRYVHHESLSPTDELYRRADVAENGAQVLP